MSCLHDGFPKKFQWHIYDVLHNIQIKIWFSSLVNAPIDQNQKLYNYIILDEELIGEIIGTFQDFTSS